MSKVFVFITILALGAVILSIFKNLKMNFYKFLVGSVGLFTICMIFFMKPLESMLINSLNYTLDIIGRGTGWFNVLKSHSILMIKANDGVLSMSINYQCSGIIELLVFSCLIIFFPFLNYKRKIFTLILGNLFLFAANIIRILFIVGVVKVFGIESFGIAHVVLGRILFFIFTVILYYRVFTKGQLANQRVGDMQ